MLDRRRFLAAAAAAVWIPGGCGPEVRIHEPRTMHINNLRNLAISLLQYRVAHDAMPADVLAPDGTPLWSWRVHMLPWIERPDIYKQLKLDEPWNSPHNSEWTQQRIGVFRWHDDPPNTTRFRAVRFAGKLFPDIDDVSDASPNARRLMLVAGGPESALPWACPGDFDFASLPADESHLKSLPERDLLIAFADSHTERFPVRPTGAELLTLLDPDGDGKR